MNVRRYRRPRRVIYQTSLPHHLFSIAVVLAAVVVGALLVCGFLCGK